MRSTLCDTAPAIPRRAPSRVDSHYPLATPGPRAFQTVLFWVKLLPLLLSILVHCLDEEAPLVRYPAPPLR